MRPEKGYLGRSPGTNTGVSKFISAGVEPGCHISASQLSLVFSSSQIFSSLSLPTSLSALYFISFLSVRPFQTTLLKTVTIHHHFYHLQLYLFIALFFPTVQSAICLAAQITSCALPVFLHWNISFSRAGVMHPVVHCGIPSAQDRATMQLA